MLYLLYFEVCLPSLLVCHLYSAGVRADACSSPHILKEPALLPDSDDLAVNASLAAAAIARIQELEDFPSESDKHCGE
jgi:hypothetical protein